MREIIKKYGVNLFLFLVGHLPLPVCRLLGRIYGLACWFTTNRYRQTTQKNIQLCFPELNQKQQRHLAFHSLQHTGMLVFEMPVIWQKPWRWLQKRLIRKNRQNLYEAAAESGQGVILLLPHVGNWEIFSTYIPTIAPAMALYEPPKFQGVEDWVKRSREKSGAKLVSTNQRGVASLLKFLRKGGAICILPDQVPNKRDRGGVFSDFFGQPVYTMTLVSQLIKKTGCQVLGATAKRVNGGFEVDFYRLPETIYSQDLYQSTTAINQFIEKVVRSMPEQYQWEYKRFKRKPN